jgi:hypothetical protein
MDPNETNKVTPLPTPNRVKRNPQVRLENLDANTIRKLSKATGIEIPYLLREAVLLLQAKYQPPVSK